MPREPRSYRTQPAALSSRPFDGISRIVLGNANIIHGGDYSPEQWTPDVWEEDMRLMRQAHCNSLTLGVFAWVHLEPEEGRFAFDWLDRMMDLMSANGYPAVLATPSAAPPIWMAQKYPDIRRVDEDGCRHGAGNRVNYCQTSPRYRDLVATIDRKLAERYAHHPALFVWHISTARLRRMGAGANSEPSEISFPLRQQRHLATAARHRQTECRIRRGRGTREG